MFTRKRGRRCCCIHFGLDSQVESRSLSESQIRIDIMLTLVWREFLDLPLQILNLSHQTLQTALSSSSRLLIFVFSLSSIVSKTCVQWLRSFYSATTVFPLHSCACFSLSGRFLALIICAPNYPHILTVTCDGRSRRYLLVNWLFINQRGVVRLLMCRWHLNPVSVHHPVHLDVVRVLTLFILAICHLHCHICNE